MPYTTDVPGGLIDLDAVTPVLTVPGLRLINMMETSAEFSKFDVDDSFATTLTRGDDLALVDSNGDVVSSGTFAGTGAFGTAATGLNLQLLATTLTVQVNPIEGSYYVNDDGSVSFISETPLSQSHLGVTISGTLLGLPLTTLNIPISEIVTTFPPNVAAPLLNVVQGVLDTAAVSVVYDPNGTLDLTDTQVVPCFGRGTRIDTIAGAVAVEDLRVGDMVRTRDHGLQTIRWIGSFRMSAACLAKVPSLAPIRIQPGALGKGTPSRPLVVSPQHRILVRSGIALRMFGTNEILVAAKQLLQLDGIDIAVDLPTVEYFHILFQQHEIIYSNGAETESLYTGPEALRGVGHAARAEILTLFPELKDNPVRPPAAREFATGRMGRRLAMRHQQNHKPLVNHH